MEALETTADGRPQVDVGRTVWDRLKEHPLARVGPGLITGVADDDPSGIATYSQAGAQFGLNMLWTMPVAYPMMAAVQSTCARIGRVTGVGLAANLKAAFPPIVLRSVVLALLASKKSVMGAYTSSRSLVALGWITTGFMGVAAAWMFMPS